MPLKCQKENIGRQKVQLKQVERGQDTWKSQGWLCRSLAERRIRDHKQPGKLLFSEETSQLWTEEERREEIIEL